MLVIGVLTASSAEVAVGNLQEEDLAVDAISVVAPDPQEARTLADVRGALHALPPTQLPARLARLGFPPATVAAYGQALVAGNVLVAVEADADTVAAVQETLADHQAHDIAVGQAPGPAAPTGTPPGGHPPATPSPRPQEDSTSGPGTHRAAPRDPRQP